MPGLTSRIWRRRSCAFPRLVHSTRSVLACQGSSTARCISTSCVRFSGRQKKRPSGKAAPPEQCLKEKEKCYGSHLSTYRQNHIHSYRVCRADLVPPRAPWISSRNLCAVTSGVLPDRWRPDRPVHGWLSPLRRLSALCALPRRRPLGDYGTSDLSRPGDFDGDPGAQECLADGVRAASGFGDLFIGVTALLAAASWSAGTRAGKAVLVLWNVL